MHTFSWETRKKRNNSSWIYISQILGEQTEYIWRLTMAENKIKIKKDEKNFQQIDRQVNILKLIYYMLPQCIIICKCSRFLFISTSLPPLRNTIHRPGNLTNQENNVHSISLNHKMLKMFWCHHTTSNHSKWNLMWEWEGLLLFTKWKKNEEEEKK